jgi:regulator of sirC expression with transglutaminase-like and TPR domain
MDDELLDAFERCGADAQADELRLAILVARTLDPAVGDLDIVTALDELADGWSPPRAPWEYLRGLGFVGDVAGYGELHNSNLAQVLVRRRGIPITLGVILIDLARRGGTRAVGVNFPGHFLVDIDGSLVDPFLLEPVAREQCIARLPTQARGAPWQSLFAPATPLAVGMRMLNNVRQAHVRLGAWREALDIVDAQLRLAPGLPALHLERGDLWLRIGLTTPAREAFESALALASELGGEDGDAVRSAAAAGLARLGDGSDTVH